MASSRAAASACARVNSAITASAALPGCRARQTINATPASAPHAIRMARKTSITWLSVMARFYAIRGVRCGLEHIEQIQNINPAALVNGALMGSRYAGRKVKLTFEECAMTTNRHWLDFPSVQALSPDDQKSFVNYAVSEDYVDTLAGAARLTPIFQLWAHVVGELPPINNVSRLRHGPVIPTLTTLAQSVACFRGVKRPYDDEQDGRSILVYVLNPEVTLARDVSLVCLAKAVIVPSNSCLTVQVKPRAALQGGLAAVNSSLTRSFGRENAEIIHGVITRVEFVPGNGETPILPIKHEGRYQERLWQTK